MSREISKEEAVNQLLTTVAFMAREWGTYPKNTQYSACQGMAFSFLAMLDGSNMALPAFNLHPSPHPDDKEYHQNNSENWWGTDAINEDVMLHDIWSKFELPNPSPTPRDGYNEIVTGAEVAGWEATRGLTDDRLKKTVYKATFLNYLENHFDKLYPNEADKVAEKDDNIIERTIADIKEDIKDVFNYATNDCPYEVNYGLIEEFEKAIRKDEQESIHPIFTKTKTTQKIGRVKKLPRHIERLSVGGSYRTVSGKTVVLSGSIGTICSSGEPASFMTDCGTHFAMNGVNLTKGHEGDDIIDVG